MSFVLLALALGAPIKDGAKDGIYGPPEPPDPTAAIAMIERLGGEYRRNASRPDKPVVQVTLLSTDLTDADLALLKDMPDLNRLSIEAKGMGDDGVAHLKDLPRLRHLSLFCPKVTDKGLAHLEALTELQSLSLLSPSIGD